VNTLDAGLLSGPPNNPAGSNGLASPPLGPPSLGPVAATEGLSPMQPAVGPGSFAASLAAASAPGSGAPGHFVPHREPRAAATGDTNTAAGTGDTNTAAGTGDTNTAAGTGDTTDAATGTGAAGRPGAHQRGERAARYLPPDAGETGAWFVPVARTSPPASRPVSGPTASSSARVARTGPLAPAVTDDPVDAAVGAGGDPHAPTTAHPSDPESATTRVELPARAAHAADGPRRAEAEIPPSGRGPVRPATSQVATDGSAPVDRHEGGSVSRSASEGAGSEPDAGAPSGAQRPDLASATTSPPITSRPRSAPLSSQVDTQPTHDPSAPPDRPSRGTTPPEAGMPAVALPGRGASDPTTSPALTASNPGTPDLPAGQGVTTGVLDRHLVTVLQPALRQSDGAWRVTVRLDPPELGTVDATVTVQDGTAAVVLSYQTETTRNALQSVLHTIQSSLGSRSTVSLADGRTGGEQAGTATGHHQPGSPSAGQNGRGSLARGSPARSSTANPGGGTTLPAGSAPRTSRYGQIDVLA